MEEKEYNPAGAFWEIAEQLARIADAATPRLARQDFAEETKEALLAAMDSRFCDEFENGCECYSCKARRALRFF